MSYTREQEESKFRKRVRADLKTLGPNVWFVKIQQVGINGTPDMLLCVAGKFVALELKRDDAQDPTPLQRYNLSEIEKAGGRSFVATPDNWIEVLGYIRAISLAIH